MKRGLKRFRLPRHHQRQTRPNPGPDEEGIETMEPELNLNDIVSPNPGPDEEGIETYFYGISLAHN